MQLFYSTDIQDDVIFLNEEESKHCVKVLRLKSGNKVNITDGNGNHYITEIIEENSKKTILQISEVKTSVRSISKLHIAIAPTKNINRFEWFLEKSVEIGINEITPIITSKSERKNINFDRLQKIVLSAMKQSLQFWLPKLNPIISYKEFLDQDNHGQKFIGHCDAEEPKHLFDVYNSKEDVGILIGPEGDFTVDEVELAKNHGYLPISLGKNRLRTETAGITACQIINLKNR